MDFKASLDRLCIVISTTITLLLLYILIAQIIPLHHKSPILSISLGTILLSTYLYCFLMRPLFYSVTQNSIKVKRALMSWEVGREQVKNIRKVAPDELRFTIRLLGVGGLFGYYGLFRNSRLGNLQMFATRRNNALLIETAKGKKIILTPDNPQALIDQFNALM